MVAMNDHAGDGEAAPVKKKVVYAKKKQAPKKQPSDAAAELEAQAAQERRQQAEVPPHTWSLMRVPVCNVLCTRCMHADLQRCC